MKQHTLSSFLKCLFVHIPSLKCTHLIFLGIVHHPINFLLGQTTLVIGDGNLVLLSSGLVLSADIQQPVGINVKGHINLGHTTGCRWDAMKVKSAQQMVVLRHRALTFEDLDVHTRL